MSTRSFKPLSLRLAASDRAIDACGIGWPRPVEQEIWSRTMTVHLHRSRPRWPRVAAPAMSILLILLAAGFLGQGIWIYAKAELAQFLLHRAWDRRLEGASEVRPWPWADVSPVARLMIRGKEAIVLSGVSGRSLAFGPGHLGGSALPGERGNCVISAHRDTDFAVLERVQIGDWIELETSDRTVHRYYVTGTRVVGERDTWVAADRGGSSLTLITCYPFDAVAGGSGLRWVVVAELDRS